MNNSNQPIFPTEISMGNGNVGSCHGLTKKEYYAGIAMQALITSGIKDETSYRKRAINFFLKLSGKSQQHLNLSYNAKTIAKNSIEMADELLKQLES